MKRTYCKPGFRRSRATYEIPMVANALLRMNGIPPVAHHEWVVDPHLRVAVLIAIFDGTTVRPTVISEKGFIGAEMHAQRLYARVNDIVGEMTRHHYGQMRREPFLDLIGGEH